MTRTSDPGTRKNADAVPRIAFKDVRKSFGTIRVLDGVSMRVNPGEVLCIIGPSGSGKSTLLKCANALEPIQGGRIVFDGATLPSRADDIRKVRQRMGMVFQSCLLYTSDAADE